jgi:hypothetical protein
MKTMAALILTVLLVGLLGSHAFSGESRASARSKAVPSLGRSAPPSIFERGDGHHHPNRAVIHHGRRLVPHYQIIYILPPPLIVITSPFFCIDHGRGFMNQAGFLDHLRGPHRISLENGLAFCSEAGSSCIFPGF